VFRNFGDVSQGPRRRGRDGEKPSSRHRTCEIEYLGAGEPDVPSPGSPGTNGHVAGHEPPSADGRATQRQLDAIIKIALAKGLKPAEIDAASLKKFTRKPAALTVKEASTLIQELSNIPRAGR
jgi:hypothetical protein